MPFVDLWCTFTLILFDPKAHNKMSYDTFECKTFSKRMGEDSEGENSEEDFDEMIMDINYFQKQNKSNEPSVVCDPLMLDPTNMNENTIMLIRRIEENLSKNKVGENLETKSDTHSLPLQQCTWQYASTSNTNSNKCIKVQQDGKRENSQNLSIVDNEKNEQSSVKRVCSRKKAQKAKKKFKSFWSPGNANSKGTKSDPEKPIKIPVETIDNLQDPSVIEMNTNKLLRDIAKDIEEYEKREQTKLHNTPLTLRNTVNKMEASTLTECTRETTKKINGDQEKSKKKSEMETAKPRMSTNNLGVKCYNCDSRFETIQLLINHSRAVHQKKKPREKPEISTGIDKTLKCKCNLNFKTTKALKHHLIRENCKFDKFQCDLCTKNYWYLQSLKLHKDLKHGALEYQTQCEICNKNFKQHIDLLNHKHAGHGDKTFSLNIVDIKIARTEAKYNQDCFQLD